MRLCSRSSSFAVSHSTTVAVSIQATNSTTGFVCISAKPTAIRMAVVPYTKQNGPAAMPRFANRLPRKVATTVSPTHPRKE